MKTRTFSAQVHFRAAFTLPEVLMAVLLCAVAMVSIGAGLGVCFRTMDDIRRNQRATQILLQTFELVRLYNWDQITTPGYLPGTIFANETNIWTGSTDNQPQPFYSGTVATGTPPFTASYSGDLILVTVQLNWKTGAIPHNRTMTTLVARQGIQSYVY